MLGKGPTIGDHLKDYRELDEGDRVSSHRPILTALGGPLKLAEEPLEWIPPTRIERRQDSVALLVNDLELGLGRILEVEGGRGRDLLNDRVALVVHVLGEHLLDQLDLLLEDVLGCPGVLDLHVVDAILVRGCACCWDWSWSVFPMDVDRAEEIVKVLRFVAGLVDDFL